MGTPFLQARPLVGRLALLAVLAMCTFAQAGAAEVPKGTLQRVVVHGRSLEGSLLSISADREVSVYLPPNYSRESKRRYPVVYALHGFGSSGADWPGFLEAPAAFDRAIAAGARPMIIVMPNAMTPLGGSMFSNSVASGDWEGFVADDLVRWTDSHYRTLADRASRGLAGFSMGGYGALRLAMKRPDVFGSVYVMSACCLAPQVSPAPAPGALDGFSALEKVRTLEDAKSLGFAAAPLAMAAAWSPNPAAAPLYFDLPTRDGKPQPLVIAEWSANAILAMVPQYVPALRRLNNFALDVGLQDPLRKDTEALHELLDAYRIKHSFQTYEGAHGDKVAARFETVVVPYFSFALKS